MIISLMAARSANNVIVTTLKSPGRQRESSSSLKP
jgi:hypothetical protein